MPWAHSWMLSNRFHSAFLPYNVRRPSCDAAFAARIRAVVISMSTDKAFRNKLQFKFVQITATVELMMGKCLQTELSARWKNRNLHAAASGNLCEGTHPCLLWGSDRLGAHGTG